MRVLWALPKAAPALLRHIAGYIDLAALDLARAHREIAAQLAASAIMVLCAIMALFFGCLAVVAYTWDTPHRVAVIAWMGGGFLAVAVAAAVYRSFVVRARSPLFAEVRREWLEDSVLLEGLLSSDED